MWVLWTRAVTMNAVGIFKVPQSVALLVVYAPALPALSGQTLYPAPIKKYPRRPPTHWPIPG